MAHSSQECSSVEPVTYVVFLTDTIYLLEDRELLQLTSPQLLLLVLFQILILHHYTFLLKKSILSLSICAPASRITPR